MELRVKGTTDADAPKAERFVSARTSPKTLVMTAIRRDLADAHHR
jgi:hypothetical protein